MRERLTRNLRTPHNEPSSQSANVSQHSAHVTYCIAGDSFCTVAGVLVTILLTVNVAAIAIYVFSVFCKDRKISRYYPGYTTNDSFFSLLFGFSAFIRHNLYLYLIPYASVIIYQSYIECCYLTIPPSKREGYSRLFFWGKPRCQLSNNLASRSCLFQLLRVNLVGKRCALLSEKYLQVTRI